MHGKSNRFMDTLSQSINPEVARLRRQAAQRKRRKRLRQIRLLWMIAGFLCLLVIVEGSVVLLTSPRFWVHRITVHRLETLTERDIVQAMQLPEHSNYFRISLKRLSKRVEAIPRVEQAIVTRKGIGILHVNVRERQPVCQLGYYSPTFYVDRHGYVFTRPTPPTRRVPVVEGVKIKSPKQLLGKRVSKTTMRSALSTIAAVTKNGNDRQVDISRVVVTPHGSVNLVLRQGALVFIGPPENLQLKAWCLKEAIIQASSKGYSLKELESINTRFVNKESGIGASFTPRRTPMRNDSEARVSARGGQ